MASKHHTIISSMIPRLGHQPSIRNALRRDAEKSATGSRSHKQVPSPKASIRALDQVAAHATSKRSKLERHRAVGSAQNARADNISCYGVGCSPACATPSRHLLSRPAEGPEAALRVVEEDRQLPRRGQRPLQQRPDAHGLGAVAERPADR